MRQGRRDHREALAPLKGAHGRKPFFRRGRNTAIRRVDYYTKICGATCGKVNVEEAKARVQNDGKHTRSRTQGELKHQKLHTNVHHKGILPGCM